MLDNKLISFLAIFITVWGCLTISYAYIFSSPADTELRYLLLNMVHGILGVVIGTYFGSGLFNGNGYEEKKEDKISEKNKIDKFDNPEQKLR